MKRLSIVCIVALAAVLVSQTQALALHRTIVARGLPSPLAFPNVAQITNPYLPMPPGTTFVYDGHLGTQAEHNPVVITRNTRNLIGIPCVVVEDTGYLNGAIEELTFDYYAQDFSGNVWYFGEYTTQYKNGKPTGHVGSWVSGVDGAQPGIIMEATPRVGDTYRQENAAPVALDMATVLSLTASVYTPYGTFIGNVLETKEFSGIGPPGPELKWYEPGIGFMKNVSLGGDPREVLELTSIVKS